MLSIEPTDMKAYYDSLTGSLADKLFFVERIPRDVTVFADFGCGDGRLLDAVLFTRWNQDITSVIGYDRAEDALVRANSRTPEGFWTPSLAMLQAKLCAHHKQGHKSCLILSSVVHEVLSEGTAWADFWGMIQSFECDYIAIRDMACEPEAKTTVAHYDGVEGLYTSRADWLQALLKSDYKEDQAKEAAEDYFALDSRQWLNLTTVGSGYSLIHYDHYSLPYHKERWRRDLGIVVPDKTHIKIILKRN